ncbi:MULTISPECIES: 3-hydroxyacyl-ACP dehydratase FabZ [Vibrio]|uniref:3-hydroxyacyl-[acyl-carrier-protein] dehydratase FabZ n=2 Tax=Vibrio genomosp. F10 TaxID=723171 RepID=A0A1B9R142_9VIBR|nr:MULTISPECIES: 3-hydroxyacyl-ACP dehydratase FabZ [Vibrio]OCH77976.1 3-hydroxyacyl-[acyl-carrier-protein] dehydratase FabZ [Vibrio genomosp. F10]OEE38456.1 3-hydroxyacyl-[acyl-carrier-protein] dehydratase FabZ [Vibrio genomosp. F10 str. ZF-129]OEE93327.1 3-hydroxyacyl-[acyl-carrier-protein] dehydratase FabZ [Vibrio genomosp. F10 str. 9ZC157]OEE96248.1 3-hydroxyacyl-[acyl-carrier-protein] dehydratase FabZ [Vibrio genomosp. F10 str. 9ZD137]OEF09206.1 3-hydroxyacyl-[acyl-carrier-protein] dehydr
MTTENKTMNITEIQELLPHRYPFLLIDRVTDYEEAKHLTAIKNVSVNEPQFTGHFPQLPVFPGVLILEAMAQATGLLGFKSFGAPADNELYYFASVDKAKFRKPVVPGDQMVIKVEFIKERRGIAAFNGVATVDGVVVCSAELKCARREF